MALALIKAIPCGIFLTIFVCLFMGSGGATGGMLNIHYFDIDIAELSLDFRLYWSWTLFLATTGLAFAILFMMGD